MTGPLPLTPTPPRTSVPTCLGYKINLPLAGAVEPRGDDSLPEKLVRDLEFSKSVFEERNMTSGAPDSAIISPYKPSSTHASSTTASRTASSRVQSLDALQKAAPMASFYDEPEPVLRFDDAASDIDSFIGTEASYDAGPSIFHTRNQSIVTNATSLASSSGRRPSSKSISPVLSSWRPPSGNHRSPRELRRESSWIEAETESEDEGGVALQEFRRHLCHQQPQRPNRQPSFNRCSSRSPRPSELTVLDGVANGSREPVLFHPGRFSHRKSNSISGPATGLSRYHSMRTSSDTWLSSPSRPEAKPRIPTDEEICDFPLPLPKFSSEFRPRQVSRRSYPIEESAVPVSKKSMETAFEEDEYSRPPAATENSRSKRHLSAAYARSPPLSTSPPHTPRVSIQLHGSSSSNRKSDDDGGSGQPFVLPFQDDELARIVPLPPDVIETLRISTMCFPETMLLSSSLTIETIRSYSKKVRQPGAERLSMAAAPQFTFSAGPAGPVMPIESTSPCAGTKSRWRRVVRRASPCSKKKRESRFWESSAEPPSATAFEAPKPWLSLKNVFGNCSDYICDALYAHIVAYNYVSALVARNPPPNPSNSRRSCSSGPSDNEDIPKKAATLLGFGQSAGAALIGVASRTGKKPRPSSKTSGVSSNDAALRAIKCGLQRCIRQLITTARLMAEEDSGEGEDRPLEMETQDNDRLLMRSLCEIVRISEGAAYGC